MVAWDWTTGTHLHCTRRFFEGSSGKLHVCLPVFLLVFVQVVFEPRLQPGQRLHAPTPGMPERKVLQEHLIPKLQ